MSDGNDGWLCYDSMCYAQSVHPFMGPWVWGVLVHVAHVPHIAISEAHVKLD